jgi:hypothetical protein
MDALKPTRQALLTLAACALVGLAAGCTNPFEPATPEAPVGNAVLEDFTKPDRLLQTMANAIENKGPSGRNAYYDAIADSVGPSTPAFYAVHDPLVVDAWRLTAQRDPPDPWDFRLEKLFYDYLIAVLPQFTYTFQWAPDNSRVLDQIDDGAGTALLHRYYVLQATSKDGKIEKIIAIGYADLYLRKVSSRWVLVRWEDRYDPTVGVNPADPDARSMGWRRLDSTTSTTSF